jgi:hypothetical protein
LHTGANPALGFNLEEQRRKSIGKAFHIDQLLMQEGNSSRTVTATEVQQKQDERLKMLGPVVGRIQSEMLNPLIVRVFSIMLRGNHFIPAPEILANQEIEIEYISNMALSQKGTQLSGIMRGMEIFSSLSQSMPITDYIDENGLAKELINILGLSAKMIRSDDEVQEIRANRQEQQAQQAEMQQAMAESQMAKNAAPAVKAINETTNKQ